MQSTYRIWTIVILSCLVTLEGCAMLHRSWEKEPFADENEFCRSGCSKSEILDQYGKPNSARNNGRIFVYASCRRPYGIFLWLRENGWRGEDVPLPFYETYLRVIEFDNSGRVYTHQVYQGDKGDLENGLRVIQSGAFVTFGAGFRKWNFSDALFILGASEAKDQEAKRMARRPDKAVVYYYKNISENFEAELDDSLSVDPGDEGFLMWVVEPGQHLISTSSERFPQTLTINCNEGGMYFIEHARASLEEVPPAVAQKEIRKRRLVVDRIAME